MIPQVQKIKEETKRKLRKSSQALTIVKAKHALLRHLSKCQAWLRDQFGSFEKQQRERQRKAQRSTLQIESCLFIHTSNTISTQIFTQRSFQISSTFEDIFLFTVVVATKFEATSLGGNRGTPHWLVHHCNGLVGRTPTKVSGIVRASRLTLRCQGTSLLR